MSRRTLIALIVVVVVVVAGGIIWLVNRKDKATPTPVLSISALNQTKNKSATETAANAQDVIVYTLTAENQDNQVISGYILETNISEISDKSSLTEAPGAAYNAGTNSLVWTPLDIPAHGSISKKFTVKVNPLPAGSTNSVMKIKFNNELSVSIAQPQVAATSTITTPGRTVPYKPPKTGPSEWVPILFALLSSAGFVVLKKYKFIKI